jgi:hypothetical protein
MTPGLITTSIPNNANVGTNINSSAKRMSPAHSPGQRRKIRMTTKKDEKNWLCSFCGITKEETWDMVAGKYPICICDSCIRLASEIILAKRIIDGINLTPKTDEDKRNAQPDSV